MMLIGANFIKIEIRQNQLPTARDFSLVFPHSLMAPTFSPSRTFHCRIMAEYLFNSSSGNGLKHWSEYKIS